MEKVKLSSLQKRVITSLVMIPLVIGALRSGHPFVDILVYLVGIFPEDSRLYFNHFR